MWKLLRNSSIYQTEKNDKKVLCLGNIRTNGVFLLLADSDNIWEVCVSFVKSKSNARW